jgi:nucleoside-diphosphate-sugar epimerase
MRVLFIGGTGNISIAATRLCAEQGVELTLLNRGQREIALPKGVRQIQADIRDRAAAAAALDGEKFDAVVDWVAFVPDHVETDIALFAGKISHYVFISSATVYERPSPFFPTVEQAPLAIRPRQDRLRGPAAQRARPKRLPGYGRAPVLHLRRNLTADRARWPGLHDRRAYPPRQEDHRARRR